MKHHDEKQSYELASAALSLSEALLCLETPEEIRAFLEDLCTPAEIEAMVDRWRVVQLLNNGMSYREISERTEVSVTTIGRVARFMDMGRGGYRMALNRLQARAER
ncbi:MAG: YerC/YecD family TrpR-related protein [Xanthomonadales bacterium]|nr:YerC/YecD family TrpR-related protein [Xanthomonadales bacterium]